jgi:tetratricopeptide (TPR) repeat protein
MNLPTKNASAWSRAIARAILASGFLAVVFCTASVGAAVPEVASMQSAQDQFKAGNYTAAVTTLQAILMQSPSNGEARYWLGRAYYELRDYDNAIAQGEKSVSLEPQNSLYHQWLGRSYGGAADRDRSFSAAKKVKKEFQAAVMLDPSNITARRDLEQYDLDAPWIVGGSKDEALEMVNAIAALNPLQGHLARAAYNHGTKKIDQAESEYRQVLNTPSAPIEAYFEVADFFQRQNSPADMNSAIQAAAKASPNDPRLAFYRGVAGVLGQTDLSGAEQSLKSYLANTPDRSDWPSHAGAREWLGRLYEAQGKRGEAAEQYRAAVQLDPSAKTAKQRLEKLGKGSNN